MEWRSVVRSWNALMATGFMVPMTGALYAAGGACCLRASTTPLGLALLSVPLAVIVPFNVLLARVAGPWIAIVAIHVGLLWQFRRAFVPLWSYDATVAPGRQDV
jgi:hypothetical protein